MKVPMQLFVAVAFGLFQIVISANIAGEGEDSVATIPILVREQ
jgi:hypothetical protein